MVMSEVREDILSAVGYYCLLMSAKKVVLTRND